MTVTNIDINNINIETAIISSLKFIVIGIASILWGFIASGRDGLLYDTRVVRGLHRISWTFLLYIFSVYSIIMSISQWSVNENNKNCILTSNGDINNILLDNNCSGNLYASNVLWIVLLILDALYINFFLSQRDYRTQETNRDRIQIRKNQKSQFIFSLIILCIRLIIHIIRMVLILLLNSITSLVLSIILIVFMSANLYFHVRAISITSHKISKYEKLDINDITVIEETQSYDDSDNDSDEGYSSNNNLLIEKNSKRPSTKMVL